MRRNRSVESIETEYDTRRSKQFGSHLQPMSAHRTVHQRKLSCEEIINEMEKEQDAMVVRLLREVERLREENVFLRKQLAHSSRSSSERDLNYADEYASNYHYSLSEASSSPRNSLASRGSRPSLVAVGSANHTFPAESSMSSQSLQRERGSNSATSGGSSSVLLSEGTERRSVTDIDPRVKIPRGWALSVDPAARLADERGVDTTRKLQEYKLR
ncbi:hypothetical protein HG536_0G01860 [Torulaspora globosa]|uniref:Uncharacterized protein n=1 Tax=Torulaspora globosa TaxID=48254 RepID=A0A7G3ZLE1_9SACH|nr:uncharacterized protein HG536_0G01860 [Torulaspora globosa]QLL34327.1 hypothetical protein HG536_0G01860 [Torulaspora globosa]